ncbi:hypothetical protein LEP1GSC166_1652 [Leptospira kirschneri]|nr:hypothetical protein LEP1GSC198_1982 [Leptospira kirschneri str. JB]EMK07574.1 hypothetical protein LEP1GSC166_1652 [Leptospira kirschneri]
MLLFQNLECSISFKKANHFRLTQFLKTLYLYKISHQFLVHFHTFE